MSNRAKLWPCVLGIAILPICWQIGRAQQAAEEKPAALRATTETLGGADRYLTHVSTDKPIYRPGEKLYVRGVALHALTNKPYTEQMPAELHVIGPKGDVVASGSLPSEQGVYAFSWEIPQGQAGGEYRVKLTPTWTGDPPAERKFDIRAYRAPRLKSQIKFLRDGYGPGDDVAAMLEVTRAEGGIPAGAKVTIVARVDEEEVHRGESIVAVDGRCVARFPLPKAIARGEGSLAMIIDDGGVSETASKTIPILLQTVDLQLYPEGGDLVAGVPNRIYFEAFTPAKKPADLAGIVVDAAGNEVAKFRSEHEGRGRFTFTPVAGRKYELQIREPAGIRSTYVLPEIKTSGVAVEALADTFDKVVRLQLASANDLTVNLTLNKREQVVARQEVKLAAGKLVDVELSAGDASGVLVATVSDATGRPIAERLVFSKPRKTVRMNVAADRLRYNPGGKAILKIATTDDTGEPISAVVGLTVTDDSVLEMIDRREQAPRLPVMALLEADVKDLSDAHVYFDSEDPQAPAAVDLLLGTQGWRRFAFVDIARFVKEHGDRARRSVALRLPSPPMGFGGGGVDRNRFAFNGRFDDRKNLDLFFTRDKGLIVSNEAIAIAHPAAPPAQAAAMFAELRARGEAAQLVVGGAIERDQLEELDEHGALALGRGGRRREPAVGNDFVAVRVFAHAVRPDRRPNERTDFTETLYWNAGLTTDERGQATVEFDLNDAVTSFRVFADAFTSAGALGSATTPIESVEPFYVEPKLPLEVTSGDVVLAPFALVNSTDRPLEALLSYNVPGAPTSNVRDIEAKVSLPSDSRQRYLAELHIGEAAGTNSLTLTAKADSFSDKVTRTLQIVPSGFPIERTSGGVLAAGGSARNSFTIPETIVPGSLRAHAKVYPSPLANMTAALERLIQQPSGCFEQTSSTVYPLVMAQQYFLDHQGVDPKLIERSAAILEDGYNRLIGFEAKGGGYEWFGADPGHDALTAYGLLEFTDMARVRTVDPQMLERTRKWFLAQRDGKGGFARKANTLHTWLPDTEVANAYNTWAAFQAGVAGKEGGDFSTEVKWLREAAKSSKNTYVLALVANVLTSAGDEASAKQIMDKLVTLQQTDGSLSGATVSVVGSSGDALAIETSALAVLAWLGNDAYAAHVEKSMKFLCEACQGGRFGSTQSTILALKAITAYDRARAKPAAPGELQLFVDGAPVGDRVSFTTDTKGEIELPEFAEKLTPGNHDVELVMTDGSQMPYSIAVEFHAAKPDSSRECKLALSVSLADPKVPEGELTEARVAIVNRGEDTVPNPIAIVGLPGGLEVRHDQLKELVKERRIAAYEVRGRDVVLYWRSLAAGERVELPISVTAAIPGRYTGPASRAYLYYTDEHKTWVDGLRVEITPRVAK